MMGIDEKVLDELLNDVLHSGPYGNCTVKCLEQIKEYLQTHNLNVFTNDVRKEITLSLYNQQLKPFYFSITGKFLPNIFAVKED